MYLVWFGFTETIISPNNVGLPPKKEEKRRRRRPGPILKIEGQGDSIIISYMCKLKIYKTKSKGFSLERL